MSLCLFSLWILVFDIKNNVVTVAKITVNKITEFIQCEAEINPAENTNRIC